MRIARIDHVLPTHADESRVTPDQFVVDQPLRRVPRKFRKLSPVEQGGHELTRCFRRMFAQRQCQRGRTWCKRRVVDRDRVAPGAGMITRPSAAARGDWRFGSTRTLPAGTGACGNQLHQRRCDQQARGTPLAGRGQPADGFAGAGASTDFRKSVKLRKLALHPSGSREQTSVDAPCTPLAGW